MLFDLNIHKVLRVWSVGDAIREFVANAIDDHTLRSIDQIPDFTYDSGNIHIRDVGFGITKENLIISESSEKAKSKNTIGQFGYGLKDAVAYLQERGHNVFIYTRELMYEFILAPKNGQDLMCYHARITYSPYQMSNGTHVAITNCTREIYNEVRSMFIQYNCMKPIFENNKGSIYDARKGKSIIYVAGLRVDNNPNYRFSYNIRLKDKKIIDAMTRERKNLSVQFYSNAIKSLLGKVPFGSPVYEIVKSIYHAKDSRPFTDLSYVPVLRHFRSLMSNDAYSHIYVTQTEIIELPSLIDDIRKSGNQVVISDIETIAEHKEYAKIDGLETKTIETYTNTTPEYTDLNIDDLSPAEREIYDQSIVWLNQHAEKLGFIRYSVYITKGDIKIKGVYRDGLFDPKSKSIRISSNTLLSKKKFLGALIREHVHIKSRADDLTRDFEICMFDVLGTLAVSTMVSTDNRTETVPLQDNPIKSVSAFLFG